MADTFDPNFCLPFRDLENDWIKLTPFNPAIDGDWYWDNTKDHPELYEYLPFGPYESKEAVIGTLFTQRILPNNGFIVYTVYDKISKPSPTPAGIIGLLDASPINVNLRIEIGPVLTFPRYQRTHVTSNAIGLLLEYCLELPENGGLGLRRVQWQANARNETSVNTALRMGFVHEGVKRWDRMILSSWGKPNSVEKPPRKGDPREADFGRHSVLMAMCWDDWEDGAREKVKELMKPR